ncbi:hypothetical protein [Pseudoalteromonas sp. PS5]|uniref:hypothetical protein n=1 Tax=Pseudoalteromonas sp. PS5 TaxID=1437473 RepID=UPI000FFF0493|nr:hypothetical protein [Pseudoalteromonas sp. PS5]RXE96041.1 hypothetical protein D9603_19295 [Pseudoalteromonas sp. PS5]
MYSNIFDHPEMKDAHIFELSNSPYKAQFYDGSFHFESNNKKIGIVDQFQGKRPAVLNREFVVDRKELQFYIVHTLILDSHIVDGLHRFISGKGKLDIDSRVVTKDFLKHVSKLNCDYSPMFYLAENMAKSSKEQFVKTSSEKLASILRLHCMEESSFVENEEIKYKKDALDHYYDLYGASNFDDCGANWAKSLVDSQELKYYIDLTRVSYACLLKMVLIHFMNPTINEKNILYKNKEFETFLTSELNILMAREVNLALYYFSNFAGKFVNVQPNMSFAKAVKNLKATAWDLLLLRLPEFLLTPSNLPEINTAYIVSSEEKLLSVGDMFNLESIFYSDLKSKASPKLSFNAEIFESVISKDKLDAVFRDREQLSLSRLQENLAAPISDSKLNWLIEDLENQLKYLCA